MKSKLKKRISLRISYLLYISSLLCMISGVTGILLNQVWGNSVFGLAGGFVGLCLIGYAYEF